MRRYIIILLCMLMTHPISQAQELPVYEDGLWSWSEDSRETIHTVTWDDTLSSIGQQYGVPYPLIAWANGLAVNDTIWVGQKLIIPISARTEDLVWLLGLWAGWFILAIPIYGRRWVKRRK
jgi:hypothetical protein